MRKHQPLAILANLVTSADEQCLPSELSSELFEVLCIKLVVLLLLLFSRSLILAAESGGWTCPDMGGGPAAAEGTVADTARST